ncbi:MAG: hypothetical protein FJ125_01160 [Deltaproteobacteria bacterium]|nr:hypothetical protein [Deltaproteobacteria bacterium]
MSPEQVNALLDVTRLRAEIDADRTALAQCLEDCLELLRRWANEVPEHAYLVTAACGLHGWYTGLEAVLERVARQVDGSIPTGERSHRILLSQEMTDFPGRRPAVLPRRLEPDLLALLSFRHFFRHAYGVRLDPARLRLEIERLLRVEPAVTAALDSFDAFLAGCQEALSSEEIGE